MTTYDIHSHCILPPLLGLLRSEGPRLGFERRDEQLAGYGGNGHGYDRLITIDGLAAPR